MGLIFFFFFFLISFYCIVLIYSLLHKKCFVAFCNHYKHIQRERRIVIQKKFHIASNMASDKSLQLTVHKKVNNNIKKTFKQLKRRV